ncbi:hypothetical protein [Variovorax gossypii]
MNMPVSETCFVHDAVANELAVLIWTSLQLRDPSLPDLVDEGVGEARGLALHVKWARSVAEPMFACEVLDDANRERWELGLADTGKTHPVAFWRRCWGAEAGPPSPWVEIVDRPHVLEPHTPQNEPSFLKMVYALAVRRPGYFSSDDGQRRQLEDEVAYWRGQARAQAKAHRAERTQLAARHQAELGRDRPVPADEPIAPARAWKLSEIAEWATENSDRIIILPRAIAATKKSDYHQASHVFEALDVLAEVYPAVKAGTMDRTELKRRCTEAFLDIGGSVDRSVAGEAGDEYFIRWRGERRFLDQHLGRGNARDPRFSMRIYFTWDEVDSVVVVGWMPSHLTAGMS